MLWHGRYLNPSVSLREPAPLRTGELSSGQHNRITNPIEQGTDAEGEGDGDWPRLVSVKRTTGTERPGASLFERKARVCDANSGVQGASSEADAALIFWFFCIKAKERSSYWVKPKATRKSYVVKHKFPIVLNSKYSYVCNKQHVL